MNYKTNLDMTSIIETRLHQNIHVQFSVPKQGFTLGKNIVKAVRGVSFDLESSQIIGIVGESGCGKSTCFQLIKRFYDSDEGQILVDGVDVKTLNVKSLRQVIGVVS